MVDTALIEEVFGGATSAINQYVDILASRGIDRGLIGPREGDRLWERHILNSVALEPFIEADASVVDVGSGAGLPGIPLAIARPDLSVVLVEPLLRRSVFLGEVVAELDLSDRVEVVRSRSEDFRGSFEVVVARAVAPLTRLIGWTKHLFLPDGQLLALKGTSAAEELEAAGGLVAELGLVADVHAIRAAGNVDETFVVRVRSVSRETHAVN